MRLAIEEEEEEEEEVYPGVCTSGMTDLRPKHNIGRQLCLLLARGRLLRVLRVLRLPAQTGMAPEIDAI